MVSEIPTDIILPQIESQTISWNVGRFSEIESTYNLDSIRSNTVTRHGFKWYLKMYPGGIKYYDGEHPASDEDVFKGHVTVLLYLKGSPLPEDCAVSFDMISCGSVQSYEVEPDAGRCCMGGFYSIGKRVDILNEHTVDDILTILCDIRLHFSKRKVMRRSPSRSIVCDMAGLLNSGYRSDVMFTIGQSGDVFRAHSLILSLRSSVFSGLFDGDNDAAPIHIDDCSPEIFQALLKFAYSDEKPTKKMMQKDARGILIAANRFALTGLKQFAEEELIDTIDASTTADLLLLADGHACAALKEAAMDFFFAQTDAVLVSDGWTRLAQSAALLAELIVATPRGNERTRDTPVESVKRLCVFDLRTACWRSGLGTDGTRGMLEERLIPIYGGLLNDKPTRGGDDVALAAP